MQGIRRKIVYVLLFEGLAIAMTTTGLSAMAHGETGRAGVAAVVSALVAVGWNLAYNTLFERWEARQTKRGRDLARRVAHAAGFEGGLVVMLVPFFAWWLGVSLVEAFVMELGLIAFFLVYTYLFNLAFDRVFGLPASALPIADAESSRTR